MADISKISPDGGTTEYNIKDATARGVIPSGASSSNKLATASDVASRVEWSSYAKTGVHNILDLKCDTTTVNGITYTVDKKNTKITLNSSAAISGSSYITLANQDNFKEQMLAFSGKTVVMTGGKSANQKLQFWSTGTGSKVDEGNGIEFTIPDSAGLATFNFVIIVASGENPQNVVISPLLKLKEDTVSEHTPYAKTNKQLTDDLYNIGNRRFILLGDSFGYGITPPSYSYDNGIGWIDHFINTVGQYNDVYYADVSVLPGVAGFASSLTFLSMIQSLENTIPSKETITDIVVLAGTNDCSGNGVQYGDIESAIETFMAYCRRVYPNAHVKIGILSSLILRVHTDSAKPLESYMKASKYGAEVVTDGVGLYCRPTDICSDGAHLTQEGYAFYTPWVNDLILGGHTSYCFNFDVTLTPDTSKISIGSTSLVLNCTYTPHFARFLVRDNNYTGSFIVDLDRTYTAKKNINDAFTMGSELQLPEVYNVLCGGDVCIKNNSTGEMASSSTWRMYTTGSKKIGIQLNTPVGSAHSGSNDYATVLFINSATQLTVPFI